MNFVLGFDFAIDKNVIQIDSIEVIKKLSQSIVNVVLKRGEFIAQIEEYNKILKEFKTSAKSSK